MSLYQLEKDGDAEALLDYLGEGHKPSIRRRAADILGELDDDDIDSHAIEKLVKTAANDDDEEVRGAAIDALDRIGTEAIERLISELSGADIDEGAEWVRAQAYIESLSADRPELRMAAANGLGRLGAPDSVSALVDHLTDPDARVRERVARACGKIGDPRTVDALRERLNNDERRVRQAAADALAAIGTNRALSALLNRLDDDSAEVRYVAVSALGGFDGPQPVDALVDALDDESDAVRRAAAYSIVELLSSAPTQRSHQIRETVVDKLDETDGETVVLPLVELLEESRQPAQRRNAAWLLGRVVDDDHRGRVIDALVDTLGDDDEMTAQFAATSLAAIGGDRVTDALLNLLDDPDQSERAESKAVFVLGKVGNEQARERLESLIESTDKEEVRKQAFAALSKLGGRR